MANFEPEILDNGDIIVYARATEGNIKGDGYYTLKKGTQEHANQLAQMKEREYRRAERK